MNISARTIFKVLGLTTLFVIMLMIAYITRRELVWIATAFFLAVALNPAVGFFAQYMPGKRRGLATGIVFILLAGSLAVFLVSFVPPLVQQSEQLGTNLPRYTDDLVNGDSMVSDQIRNFHLVDHIKESQDQLVSSVSSAGGSFLDILQSVFSGFAASITVLGLTFFMLLEGPGWLAMFWRAVPERRRHHAQELAAHMYEAMTGYVTGNLLTSLLAAVTTTITLTIVHVPYAISLGILVGIFDLLPLIGATLGAIIVILVALFSSVPAAIIMLIFFIIYQQLENHILQPIVYGRTVQMSPLLVLVSVLIGAAIGGIIGALMAIPVFASLQILVRDYTKHHLVRD